MHTFIHLFQHALMISTFVGVMMLIVEYFNVLSQGRWQERMASSRWLQYVFAAFLGATPGCLGAFMAVSLYTHRIISIGALTAAMIATSGDEAFVMFAIMPAKALYLTGILFISGIVVGVITDFIPAKIFKREFTANTFPLHDEDHCNCYPSGEIIGQLKKCSLKRGFFILTIGAAVVFIILSPQEMYAWDWKKITLLALLCVSFFIVVTVPDHFLEKHLWGHVIRIHLPKIFLWTLGAFVVIHVIIENLNLESVIKENASFTLLTASLVGLIPESGPHLFFITLFSKGVVPFSVVIASSIVQDGHGMLPLLGHSGKDFLKVKAVNLVAGLLIGYAFLLSGM